MLTKTQVVQMNNKQCVYCLQDSIFQHFKPPFSCDTSFETKNLPSLLSRPADWRASLWEGPLWSDKSWCCDTFLVLCLREPGYSWWKNPIFRKICIRSYRLSKHKWQWKSDTVHPERLGNFHWYVGLPEGGCTCYTPGWVSFRRQNRT